MLLRLALLTLVIAATAHGADLPPGATVLDDNLLWDVTDPDTAVVGSTAIRMSDFSQRLGTLDSPRDSCRELRHCPRRLPAHIAAG
jgi:hypothetical protein